MEIKNIKEELRHAPVDEKANLKLVKLAGDSTLSVFAAELAPQKSLNPHYHKTGIETYQIYSGSGIMKTGTINGIALEWTGMTHAVQGDFFSIDAYTVHQIINNTEEPLVLIFCCPENHLGSDRYFIQKEN